MMQDNTQRALHSIADLLLTGPVRYDAAHVRGHAASSAPYHFPGTAPRVQRHEPRATAGGQRPIENVRDRLEVLFAGKLPGYPAPWIGQYAHHLAKSDGPVAVVRIDGPRLEIETYDGTPPGRETAPPHRPGPSGAKGRVVPSAELLHQTLRDIARCCRRLLLVCAEPLPEAYTARAAEVDRWTLLCGCDDEAVVATYQLLKRLLADPSVTGPSNGVGLVFAGCDEATAEAACARVRRAANKFLEVPIDLTDTIRRMEPAQRHAVGVFDCETDAWATLMRAWNSPARHDDHMEEPDEPLLTDEELRALNADEPPFGGEPLRAVEPAWAEPDIAATPAPDPIELPRSDKGDTWQAAAPAAPAQPMPSDAPPSHAPQQRGGTERAWDIETQQPDVAAKQTVAQPAVHPHSASPSEGEGVETPRPATRVPGVPGVVESRVEELSRYIPGLTPVPARCPRQPRVQFAVDTSGRLHLLLQAEWSTADAAVRQLLHARLWGVEHRSLLTLTYPATIRSDPGPEAAPVMHLFTDSLKPLADLALAGLPQDRGFRLHLLKPVTVAGETVMVHEELS